MAALEALLDGIMARWAIPPAGVIAHSDMAPGRKADPGPKFDWRRLARGGRAVWAGGGGRSAGGLGGVPRGGGGGGLRRRRATGRRCWRRSGCGSGLGRGRRTLRGCGRCGAAALALTGARRRPSRAARGWPDGRGPSEGRGKSGLQGEMAAGNARPGQPEGKRHREQTAPRLRPAGKGETVG